MNKCKIVAYHYVRPIKNSQYPEIKGLELEEFKKQIEYFNWLDVYLKMYVIANLSIYEIEILTQQNNLTKDKLLEYTKKVSLKELLISTKKLILDRDK